MLAGSGVPELETRVLRFLAERAAVLHKMAVLDDTERLLAQVCVSFACIATRACMHAC